MNWHVHVYRLQKQEPRPFYKLRVTAINTPRWSQCLMNTFWVLILSTSIYLYRVFFFPQLSFPTNSYSYWSLTPILTSASGSAFQHSQANLLKECAFRLRRQQIFSYHVSCSKGKKMGSTSCLFQLRYKFYFLTDILSVLLLCSNKIRCTLLGHTALFIH